jgi:hypothetical protein
VCGQDANRPNTSIQLLHHRHQLAVVLKSITCIM